MAWSYTVTQATTIADASNFLDPAVCPASPYKPPKPGIQEANAAHLDNSLIRPIP